MHTNTHSPAITEHKITAFSPCLPAVEKQIVTSPAPANPSPVGFLPVPHPASGDGTLVSLHHPVTLWGRKLRPGKTPELQSPRIYLAPVHSPRLSGHDGGAAFRGAWLRHHSTAPPCYLLKEETSRRSACCRGSSCCCMHRAYGSSIASWAPPPFAASESILRLWDCWRGEDFCGAERGKAGWNFPSALTACPHTGLKSAPYIIKKFSLQVFKQTSHFSKCQTHQLQRGSCISAEINFALLTKAMWRAKQGHMRGTSVLISWFRQQTAKDALGVNS